MNELVARVMKDVQVYIRCMCVLPMGCGSRKTETSAYDWVAIAVGLSSGHVRFFTEHGVLLRSEHVSYKSAGLF